MSRTKGGESGGRACEETSEPVSEVSGGGMAPESDMGILSDHVWDDCRWLWR